MDSRNKKVSLFYLRSGVVTDQLSRHLKEGLTVIKYHGSGRPKGLDTIQDSDVVLTTYNTLTAEFQIKSKPSPLHQVGWYRVVLDEGKPLLPLHVPRANLTTPSTHHPPLGDNFQSRLW